MTRHIEITPQTPPRDLTEAELRQVGGGRLPTIFRATDVTLKRGAVG